jgi:hypothetical protein
MSTHVSDDALLDLALGEGAAAAREHAAACESCARRVAEARASLELARRSDVPEPSPLYWESMRRGVSRRIAEEGARASRFQLLVPVAAAAALVAVLLTAPAVRREGPVARPLEAWSPLPAAEEDEGLQVLEGVALASGDLAEWDEARGLADTLAGLTDEESRVLAEALRERGQGGES